MAERYSSAQVVMELVLHEAAANGDDRRIEELQIYLKRGKILINQPDVEWGNRTPLHCAAERGKLWSNIFVSTYVSKENLSDNAFVYKHGKQSDHPSRLSCFTFSQQF